MCYSHTFLYYIFNVRQVICFYKGATLLNVVIFFNVGCATILKMWNVGYAIHIPHRKNSNVEKSSKLIKANKLVPH